MPIWLSIAMILGVSLGIFVGKKLGNTNPQSSRDLIDEALGYIQNEYVDTVNVAELQQTGIEAMLEKLDPHSAYIAPKDLAVAQASLEADFEGIGIEFQIIHDTVNVITPISGGPSEQVGLQAGDKIVDVDGKQFAGTHIATNDVFAKLRGKKGTVVKLSIKREGIKDRLNFNITRDKIPTHSLDAAYLIDSNTGYIKLNRFGEKTYDEFKEALDKLKSQGMKRLLLDLRDNPGGYLDHAASIADEFLSDSKMIVYTKSRKETYSNNMTAVKEGVFESGDLIVLVDEGSASASEIVAGALQDNDRALIVGRRTFGKGLVQMPINLSDGSELRLTISRYYTPSGRCIQKPYHGNREDYELEFLERYKHGELYSKDSIHFADSLKYKTTKGRVVYGGGGIMPDIFVPQDTSAYSKYLSQLLNGGVLRSVAIEVFNANKDRFSKMTLQQFVSTYQVSDADMSLLQQKAAKENIKFDSKGFTRSEKYIRNYMKALVAKSAYKTDGFYYVFNQADNVYVEALKHWMDAEKIVGK
jgi:carboxyl-terminal processing protease